MEELSKPESEFDQNLIEVNNEMISLDDFCDLGNKLLEQEMYEEAVSLYETATKLFPDSLAIKLNLGRAQDLERKKQLRKNKELQADIEKVKAEDDVLAQHYLSLASLYYSRRKFGKALELLGLSKNKNGNVSKTRYLIGKIYHEQGDNNKALSEFLKAKDLDPFYEDIYKHLGILFYERKDYEQALESFIDAYILSGGEDITRTSYYQRQIRFLLNDLKVEDKKELYNHIFQEKKKKFLEFASSFTEQKEAALDEIGAAIEPVMLKFREFEKGAQTSLNLALELKKFPVMQGLSDDELLQVARITNQTKVLANETIFREDDLTEGIYFLQSGSVRIIKPTPFGEQILSTLSRPEFFGEMDFIDSLRCSADAIANEDSTLFLLSKVKLEDLFISEKHVAVQF
jgi:tetratricopeptide (TPR) repeat protein